MEAIHLLAIVILMIIGFAATLAAAIDNDDNYYVVVFISVILVITLFVFFFVGTTKCEKSEQIYSDKPYATEKIAALNDNNMMSGRIYIRSGYIEEDLYYQYIVKLNNGGFVSNRVKSSNATLFYDTDNYRVEWYKKTRGWLYFKDEVTYVEIYIPEGSITMDYMIDLN